MYQSSVSWFWPDVVENPPANVFGPEPSQPTIGKVGLKSSVPPQIWSVGHVSPTLNVTYCVTVGSFTNLTVTVTSYDSCAVCSSISPVVSVSVLPVKVRYAGAFWREYSKSPQDVVVPSANTKVLAVMD